jgi:hypothetical protein
MDRGGDEVREGGGGYLKRVLDRAVNESNLSEKCMCKLGSFKSITSSSS